jgi:hypothetical protein
MKLTIRNKTIFKNIIWTSSLVQNYVVFNLINFNYHILLLLTSRLQQSLNHPLVTKWLIWSSTPVTSIHTKRLLKHNRNRLLPHYSRSVNVVWRGSNSVLPYIFTTTVLNFNNQRFQFKNLFKSTNTELVLAPKNQSRVNYYFKLLNHYFILNFYIKQYYLLTFLTTNFTCSHLWPAVIPTQPNKPLFTFNSFKFL